MSTIVGNIVLQAKASDPGVPSHVVASSLAVVVGAIVCFLGVIRLGRIVEFISLPAVSAFITGSSISIAVGQLPTLVGTSSRFNTRDAAYLVFINWFRWWDHWTLDAAIGITALVMLYLIRAIFNYLSKIQPNRKKTWFFCNTLRSVFVILLYTLIGWASNRDLGFDQASKAKFSILGPVPRGFTTHEPPVISQRVFATYSTQIPISVIVLLIEHISIAKSFGRINNYTINPSQELVAIGVTNLLGPFLGAYPATGSFSRTAIKSKAGVRTPFAGVITALVVLLAIYALPAVFFYIPNAALAAIIIHAVGDLITPPNTVYQFWKISPIEVVIFFAGVIVTIFTTIEIGIYVTVISSFVLQIWRLLFVKGRFLGKLQVHSVVAEHIPSQSKNGGASSTRPDNDPDKSARSVFVPLEHNDGSNPNHIVKHPYPGIFIYRFSEGYTYASASAYLDEFVQTIFANTRRTDPSTFGRPGDRPWNDPAPRRGKPVQTHDDKPTLKAVILDFASVNNTDLTSVQSLIDVRNQLDRYAQPHAVQWHFANIHNRWTKRALAAAGFGYPTPEPTDGFHRWKPVFSVAEIGGEESAAAAAEEHLNKQELLRRPSQKDVETGHREIDFAAKDSSSDNSLDREITRSKAYNAGLNNKIASVQGLNRPLFHIDLTAALQSAVSNVQRFHPNEDAEYIDQQEGWKPEKNI